ncbi:MAG: hypothetical protein HC833_20825 [Leptolyngbyaceae cyanobacterium RM1_406_9]|nr:hypothetical protein [Leptolyngbyaceae cyanobacterium RM1_406_9]
MVTSAVPSSPPRSLPNILRTVGANAIAPFRRPRQPPPTTSEHRPRPQSTQPLSLVLPISQEPQTYPGNLTADRHSLRVPLQVYRLDRQWLTMRCHAHRFILLASTFLLLVGLIRPFPLAAMCPGHCLECRKLPASHELQLPAPLQQPVHEEQVARLCRLFRVLIRSYCAN